MKNIFILIIKEHVILFVIHVIRIHYQWLRRINTEKQNVTLPILLIYSYSFYYSS